MFIHLKFCLATATHNFKWAKITHISLFSDQTFAKLVVLKTHFFSNDSELPVFISPPPAGSPAQFSLHVYKGGLKYHSFYFICRVRWSHMIDL